MKRDKIKKERYYECPCGCGAIGNDLNFLIKTCANKQRDNKKQI